MLYRFVIFYTYLGRWYTNIVGYGTLHADGLVHYDKALRP